MKYLSFILVALLLFSCDKNKKNDVKKNVNVDNVEKYFKILDNDNIDLGEKKEYNSKILLFFQKNPSRADSKSLDKLCDFFYKFRVEDKLKLASDLYHNNSLKTKDTFSLAKAYNFKGKYYNDIALNDSAFYYFVKAEKIFLKFKDSIYTGKNYLNKSTSQITANDNIGAIRSSIQAIKYLKNTNETINIYLAYNNIADSSDELEDYENALIYYKKALDLLDKKKIEDNYFLNSSLKNNIGYVYLNQKKYKDAIEYFNKGLNVDGLAEKNPSLNSMLLDNLAYTKFKIKDFENLPDLFYKSLRVREKEKLYSGIIINKWHLSEYYYYIKDTLKSQKYANEALELAISLKNPTDIITSYKQLFLVDKKKSILYADDFIKLNDSIQMAERKSQERFARIAFETDEIIEEKGKLEEKNRTLLYVFIGVMVVVSLLFIVRAQRARTRELIYKQAQQKANEDIYNLMISQQNIIDESRTEEKKKIARDLHDGVLGRMFGARLNLDSLNGKTDEESIKKRLGYLEELKNIEQDIREISHDLNREKQVLINNFVSIVSNLLEEQNSSHEAELVHFIDNTIQWDKINNTTKINMYRMLQESLQNINKYAKATQINVEFKKIEENLVLTILDNGEGFDVNKKNKGIGVQNMISRTHECNGIIDISSIKGTGTSIIITIPIETKKEIIET